MGMFGKRSHHETFYAGLALVVATAVFSSTARRHALAWVPVPGGRFRHLPSSSSSSSSEMILRWKNDVHERYHHNDRDPRRRRSCLHRRGHIFASMNNNNMDTPPTSNGTGTAYSSYDRPINGERRRQQQQQKYQVTGNQTTSTRSESGVGDVRRVAVAVKGGGDDEDDDDDAVQVWREKILALAFRTMCGFRATPTDRQRMKYLIQQLSAAKNFTAAREPTAAYYYHSDGDDDDNDDGNEKHERPSSSSPPSLIGKWTLVYTDAPDILGLADGDTLARVQRIGQECRDGGTTIINVIEWVPPVWLGALPTSIGGTGRERILQKVITRASANPGAPYRVDLSLRGIEVVLAPDPNHRRRDDASWNVPSPSASSSSSTKGLLPSWLRQRPIRLQGPWTAPLGSFDILYLDDEIRIIRTDRGYYSINKRNTPRDAWF